MKPPINILMLIIGLISLPANATNLSERDDSPRAEFRSMYVDYDVYENDIKGMRIHVDFTTYEMKDIEGYLAIYFEDDAGPLKDRNQAYYTTSGTVGLFRLIKPLYETTDYNDLQLFMPYVELDLNAGSYKLKMNVKVIYKEGGAISWLTTRNFEYSQTDPGGYNSPDATFKNLRVDFDVYQNEVKGMRIHVDFSVKNLKGIDCYLTTSVYTDKDAPVSGTNPSFVNENGQAATFSLLTPGYDETEYKDLQLFLPYSALSVDSGRQNLKLDVDVTDIDGELIKHLTYYDFWYER